MLDQPSADTAAGSGFRDETAERIGIYLQRLAAVSAHKVVPSHPCDHDIRTSCPAPAAGD